MTAKQGCAYCGGSGRSVVVCLGFRLTEAWRIMPFIGFEHLSQQGREDLIQSLNHLGILLRRSYQNQTTEFY